MSFFKSFSILFCTFAFLTLSLPLACTPPTSSEKASDGGSESVPEGSTEKTFQPLSADGYTTVSNVLAHNKLPADIGDLRELFAQSPVDWTKVQVLYEKGKNSVNSNGSIRTLNGFASTPDNFKKYSPEATAFFKDNGICQLAPITEFACTEGKFVDEYIEFYAINGKGPFEKASDKARIAAVNAGLMTLMSYWVRLEFGKALEKVAANQYEPLEGAPHNWDEAFAFYWGPEGKHSLYALASALSTKYALGSSINKDFFQALIDGLKEMQANKSPSAFVESANKQLIRLFVLGALDAAKELQDAADDEAKAAARWRGFGYWLAIGHAIQKADANAATVFADIFFTKKIDADVLKQAKDAVKAALTGLGFQEDDFGNALK